MGASTRGGEAASAQALFRVLAVDPGTTQSAILGYECETGRVMDRAILENTKALECIRHMVSLYDHFAIEMFQSYGMAVGAEVFRTCVWIGRFQEAWGGPETSRSEVMRSVVKLHLCGSTRAKDPNVRLALIDRYGPGKAIAIGRKKMPGPLYGISSDLWAALAVAVTWSDTR